MSRRDKLDRTVTVVVGELESFDREDFRENKDQFQNALILPMEIFDRMGITPYSYAEISPTNREWDSSEVVYALPFDEGFEIGENKPTGLLKTSYQQLIFNEQTSESRKVDVRPHETAIQLENQRNTFDPVRLPVTSETGLSSCRMNKGDMERLGYEDGDMIEVYNPKKGNRVTLEVQSKSGLQKEALAVGNVIRDSLRVISVDEKSKCGWSETVGVREPVKTSEKNDPSYLYNITSWIIKEFVGYNRVNLEVRPGLDIDEERRIVRVEPDTRNLLGIESGDKVVIEWNGNRHKVRCLDVPEDTDVSSKSAASDEMEKSDENNSILTGNYSSNHIYTPSTDRRTLDACIGDIVKVNRDMKYTMGKQVSLSILSILGVLVAGDIVFSPTRWLINIFISPYISATNIWIVETISTLVTFLFLSILIIYVLLYPKRQEVSG